MQGPYSILTGAASIWRKSVKRPLNLVASPFQRNYGIACTWSITAPGWRQNRNNTQILKVTLETATALTVDDLAHKSQVTVVKTYQIRGSAVASYQPQTSKCRRIC